MTGMPSAAASSAAAAARSTESRSTAGIEGTGTRASAPSVTKIGQMKSAGLSVFSATSLRDQGVRRLRRMRVVGNRALDMAAENRALREKVGPGFLHRQCDKMERLAGASTAQLGAARAQFHEIDMEMIAVIAVGARPENRVEIAAGALAQRLDEVALCRKPHLLQEAARSAGHGGLR